MSEELAELIATGRARELRELAGLTLVAAAKKCGGVHPAAVLRWERSDRRPMGRNVGAYLRFLRRLEAAAQDARSNEEAA